MLYNKLSSKNYTAGGWNKYVSHYSQEGRWIRGTCNFVVEKGLEEWQWMDKNNADSELENAMYVHKPILFGGCMQWYGAPASFFLWGRKIVWKTVTFIVIFIGVTSFFFFFPLPLGKELQLLEVSCVRCWSCPKFLTYFAVLANEKAPAYSHCMTYIMEKGVPLYSLCSGSKAGAVYLASTIFCTISFSPIATPVNPFISNMLHTIIIPPTWPSIK